MYMKGFLLYYHCPIQYLNTMALTHICKIYMFTCEGT